MPSITAKAEDILKPLVIDYRNALNLCQRIRIGLKGGISINRIKVYADFFFASQLLPLFGYEEEYLFPLLGEEHPLVKRSISEHQILKHLLEEKKDLASALEELARELEELVKFKEEEFYKELRKGQYSEGLSQLRNKDKEVLTPQSEDWDDRFWLKTNLITTSVSF